MASVDHRVESDANACMSRSIRVAVVLCGVYAGLACSAAGGNAGLEGGPCIEGECFDGLSCYSNICVGDEDSEGADDAEGDGGGDGATSGSPGDGGPGGNPDDDDDDDDDGDPDDGDPDDGDPDDGDPDDGDPDDGDPDDGDPDDGNPDDGNPDDDDDDDVGGCEDDPGLPLGSICNPLVQDCGGCAKCLPTWNGQAYEAATCVALTSDPAGYGESCSTPLLGGVDDCDEGLICMIADAALSAECAELCTGTPGGETCETPGNVCTVTAGGVLPVCYEECDPLMQDCGVGNACYRLDEQAVCLPVLGNVAEGDPCVGVNQCEPGTTCMPGAYCESGSGCCQSFCEVGGDTCPTQHFCYDVAFEADAGVCGWVD